MKHFNFKSVMNNSNVFKKAFFLSIVLVLGFNSLYAQKCKLEKIKDDFDSTNTFVSKEVNLASVFPIIGSKKPWDLVMNFMLIDSSMSISVTHQSQKYSTSLSSIFFKFQDGTVIKKETSGTTGKYNTGLGYSYTYTSFDLTKEDLMLLASKDLLKFQAVFTNFPDYPVVEEDMKSKSIVQIRQDASCLLSELNSFTSNYAKKNIKKHIEFECKYETDKIDAFTKKRTVATNCAVFFDQKKEGGHTFFQVSGTNINGANGLRFWFCISVKGMEYAVESSLKSLMLFDQVDILLQNDEPISLMTTEPSGYVHQDQDITAWSYKLFTIENDSIWQKLKTMPAKTLRLSMNGKPLWTQEIDKNSTKSLMNVINCIDALGIPKSK